VCVCVCVCVCVRVCVCVCVRAACHTRLSLGAGVRRQRTPAGQLLELDGTKRGPLVVAEGCADVLRGTIGVIQQRLAQGEYSERLSLMTLNANQS